MSQIDARLSDAEKRLVPTQIAANSISGTLLQTNSVDSNTLADNAVTNRHIESGAVDTSQLADNSVNSDKIANNAVNINTTATTTTGNIITGILQPANGGLGIASYTANGALYSANGSTISTGTLPIQSGGTGAATFASGAYLKGNGTGAFATQSGIPAGDITSGTLATSIFPTGAPTLFQGGLISGVSGLVTTTFSPAFSATPAISLTPRSTSRTYRIDSLSSTSFTCQDSPASGAAVSVNWIAVGLA